MKTNFLKMVLPAFALLLAVFGAFAFKSVEDKALLAAQPGWISPPGQPCSVQVQCDNTVKPFMCTAIHNGVEYQAFGKLNPQSPCNITLYRLN
ncbi:DUF6520 family protein [Flavobacterium sp.]|uniref:DUF6520 family protein n=1 Tax=Flavobacterium sp. TaxID=239 RepID=UPI004034C7C3